MLIPLLIVAGALVVVLAGCQAVRGGYETAPYKVVRSNGKIEIRDYPALLVVETTMADEADGSFRRLFRFITGGNEEKQKIAMTTPVFMSGHKTNKTMAFVLPATLKSGTVPAPVDGSVKTRELESGRFAVLRFHGGRSSKNEQEALRDLESWMSAEKLTVKSSPVYAYFDPPWTPGFLRRNEVMLRTESPK